MTPAHAKASGSMVVLGSSWRDGSGVSSLKILPDTQRGWEPNPTASSCPELVPLRGWASPTPRRVTEKPGLAECFRRILPERAPRTAFSIPAPQTHQGFGSTHFQTPSPPNSPVPPLSFHEKYCSARVLPATVPEGASMGMAASL